MKTRERLREFDLMQIINLLIKRVWVIILSAFLFAGAAFCWTYYFVQPKYEANVMFYVNNSSISVGNVGVSISSSDLTAAQKLVDTYVVILKTRSTLNEVVRESGLDMSYEDIYGRISAKSVNSTEVFRVVVWDYSPTNAEKIANTIARVLPDKIASIVDGSSVKIVDTAVVPTRRSSPSYTNNTFIGFVLGAILAILFIIIAKFSDPYIKDENYVTEAFNLPLLSTIPTLRHNVDPSGKYGDYAYRYRK